MKQNIKPFSLKMKKLKIDLKELKYRNLDDARRKQDEMFDRYGYKPNIFQIVDKNQFLIIKPGYLNPLKKK